MALAAPQGNPKLKTPSVHATRGARSVAGAVCACASFLGDTGEAGGRRCARTPPPARALLYLAPQTDLVMVF